MGRRLPSPYLLDADCFFFYLRGGELEDHAARLIDRAAAGELSLRTSSEGYDDAVSAIRGRGGPLSLALQFIADMKTIPHEAVPISAEIAEEALQLYSKFGGPRHLHYFDAFHVAASKRYSLTLVTSDRYVLDHQAELGISAKALSDF